ncbi:vWA domain-containing protein [Corallococcus aberystwythensis]|uniref:VWA domain-containing protein n=1 Tax=Corallococcus aberystwythensis TaxID=2316722 RepID=A0A3A8QNJ9_9BACT|nr:VWA domain-containing protein [Corallococcus aberystwythensis]RKH69398.1 VWA domain-containing protein [Corallococcus aberystwythensis]
MTSPLKEFTSSAARPLPVILLADVSGSMAAEGKIDALNQSVREMLSTFTSTDDLRAEIHVAVITFGGEARVHTSLQPASAVKWSDLVAEGGTPMGQAMTLAADLVDDREKLPVRAYRPTIVLISDGQPTDSWQAGLERVTRQGRAQKADRMALAIGGDADVDMLRRFLNDEKKQVFVVADARRIKDFFQFVTLSVTARSRSANPNDVPRMQNPFDIDHL